MTRKYNISIDIVEKLASLCFDLFGKAHQCQKYISFCWPCLSTLPTELSAHAHNLAQYVFKDSQQAAGIDINAAARGVRALEL